MFAWRTEILFRISVWLLTQKRIVHGTLHSTLGIYKQIIKMSFNSSAHNIFYTEPCFLAGHKDHNAKYALHIL